MPDKHEVGGSSPLGPTKEFQDSSKLENTEERPRAFIERKTSIKACVRTVQGTESFGKPKACREI